LHRRRHVADFVKKEGAISSFAKHANAIGGGTGEGAFDVSKKFALQQVCGYGRAVDRDKGFVLREPWSCSARATSSLPVPVSPRIKTVASLSAARPIIFCTRRIASLEPMSVPVSLAPSAASGMPRRGSRFRSASSSRRPIGFVR
jgi:hypothetical protein